MVEFTDEAIVVPQPGRVQGALAFESGGRTVSAPNRASPETIAVWGPGGSPGRSTVAINLADSITRLGYSVLLVDADLFNPSLSLMLGAPMQGHTLSTLFAELSRNPNAQLKDFVAETNVKGLSILPGVSSLARASEIRIELFSSFLSAAAAYDYLVFDVAGDLSQPGSAATPERLTRFLVRESHRMIAVGEANILGIDRLAKQAVDLRKLRHDRPFRFLLNRVESKRRSTVDAAELFERLTKEKVSATLPLDRKTLGAALERGCPASTIRQRGEFSKAMLTFATTLVTP